MVDFRERIVEDQRSSVRGGSPDWRQVGNTNREKPVRQGSMARGSQKGTQPRMVIIHSDIGQTNAGRKPINAANPSVMSPKPEHEEPDMDQQGERELTDQKLAASEARFDTKLANLDGKLNQILTAVLASQAESKETKSEIRSAKNANLIAAIGTVVALGGLIIGMFTYGSNKNSEALSAIQTVLAAKPAEQPQPTILFVPTFHPRPITPTK